MTIDIHLLKQGRPGGMLVKKVFEDDRVVDITSLISPDQAAQSRAAAGAAP